MCIYGLYCWKFASRDNDDNSDFHYITAKTMYVLSIVFVVFFGVVFIALNQFPNAQVPISDALIAVLSIIATWMAAKKIVECWYIWIFVNIFASVLFVRQELYPTAVLFTLYSILSFAGLMEWRKSVKKNDTANTRF